jgi:site-specific DNA-methyltransferase (adenine-specific)
VPSARALVYADKRANPAGRLPDDTWILRPQDLPEGFQPTDDTWYYARVAGTFKERQGFHGCQMPEQLLGRIVRVSSNVGEIVLDPFAGSGTTLAVAKKLGRKWLGCELSIDYVRAASERLDAICDGDFLDGPADPIASAPSTANGRRLGGTGSASVSDEGAEEVNDSGDLNDTPTEVLAEPVAPATGKRGLRELVREAIVDSFFAAHDGYSIDWLLASPSLQRSFHEACCEAGLIGGPADWNRELLRIRKQGGFPHRGEIKSAQIPADEMDGYEFAAEIAWQLASDKLGGASLDEIFCDPKKARYFDRTAKRFGPGFEPSRYRWAALRMRKASRELVRDVKQYHFVFAKRDFGRFQAWDRFDPARVVGRPGIYLLRGERKEPLFIGRALDLGRRLTTHEECAAMADVIEQVSILAGDDLPGEEYQAAFKEDLVRRHRPRWNVNLVGLLVD